MALCPPTLFTAHSHFLPAVPLFPITAPLRQIVTALFSFSHTHFFHSLATSVRLTHFFSTPSALL